MNAYLALSLAIGFPLVVLFLMYASGFCNTQAVSQQDGVTLYRTCDVGRVVYFSKREVSFEEQSGKVTIHHSVPSN